MPKLTFLLLAILAAPTHSSAAEINFIAMGDAPYFLPEGSSMFEKLLSQINKEKPEFAVHIGDIRGGITDCSDNILLAVKDQFQSLEVPLVYTPGDNEWTDCHRHKTGPNDPLERLSFLRKIFFSDAFSLGKKKIPLEQQSDQKRFSAFAENRSWMIGDVLFFTLHIVGSNNNYSPENPNAMAEFQSRMEANLAWIDHNFTAAKKTNAKAVVLFFQANLEMEKKPEKREGFNPLIEKLASLVPNFPGHVLAVHGDTHIFRIDHPLKVNTPWNLNWPVANFTRLEVYGAPDVRGVKVNINTSKSQPFSFSSLESIPWEYPKN